MYWKDFDKKTKRSISESILEYSVLATKFCKWMREWFWSYIGFNIVIIINYYHLVPTLTNFFHCYHQTNYLKTWCKEVRPVYYKACRCYRAIWEIFHEFLISCKLSHEPLGEQNNCKIWKMKNLFVNIALGSVR